jgi:hypothetical protein
MSRHAQPLERETVVSARQPEGDAAPTRLSQAQQELIARRPFVFIHELADLLETSERTIERQLRAGTFFIPEAPKVDRRRRWSRERIYRAIADTTLDSHRRSLLGPWRVPPRKNVGEAARERSGS